MIEKKGEIAVDVGSSDHVHDRFRIVYILFVLVGVIHLLPATFFVTANDFWMYKFRNTSSEEYDSDHRTYYQIEFSPSVTIASHVASVVFSFYLIFIGHKQISVPVRVYGALISVLIMYIISAIFINVDTDSWQVGFFVFTMIVIALINGMGAIFGLSALSIIAKFPQETLGAYITGQGISGIVSSFLQVIALAVGISTTKSAMVYFWIAIGMILISLLYLLSIFKYNNFFRHYNSIEPEKKQETAKMDIKEFFVVAKLLWKTLFIMFFMLLGSNALHPPITALVVSEGEGNGDWNDVYFVPVTTYLLTAVAEYIARILTVYFNKFFTKIDAIWYVLFSAVRIVIFTPLIMFCNAQPRNHMSVIFPHDYQYIIIVVAFAFSGGFLLPLSNYYIAKSVPPEKVEDGYHVFITWASILTGALSVLGFFTVDLL